MVPLGLFDQGAADPGRFRAQKKKMTARDPADPPPGPVRGLQAYLLPSSIQIFCKTESRRNFVDGQDRHTYNRINVRAFICRAVFLYR